MNLMFAGRASFAAKLLLVLVQLLTSCRATHVARRAAKVERLLVAIPGHPAISRDLRSVPASISARIRRLSQQDRSVVDVLGSSYNYSLPAGLPT